MKEKWYIPANQHNKVRGILNRNYNKVITDIYSGKNSSIEIVDTITKTILVYSQQRAGIDFEHVPIIHRDGYKIIKIQTENEKDLNLIKRKIRKGGIKLERCLGEVI